MVLKIVNFKLYKLTILNSKDFMKKHYIKDNTMTESVLQKLHNYSIYPRDSEKNSNNGFVKIDNGTMGGTHWTCFHKKDKKIY